jgi:hypothetical protein
LLSASLGSYSGPTTRAAGGEPPETVGRPERVVQDGLGGYIMLLMGGGEFVAASCTKSFGEASASDDFRKTEISSLH